MKTNSDGTTNRADVIVTDHWPSGDPYEGFVDTRPYATCWWCGHKLIWQNDFDREDYGLEGEGMVTILICSGCKAEVQMTEAEQ